MAATRSSFGMAIYRAYVRLATTRQSSSRSSTASRGTLARTAGRSIRGIQLTVTKVVRLREDRVLWLVRKLLDHWRNLSRPRLDHREGVLTVGVLATQRAANDASGMRIACNQAAETAMSIGDRGQCGTDCLVGDRVIAWFRKAYPRKL